MGSTHGSTRLGAMAAALPAATPDTRVVKKLAAGARGAQRWQRVYGGPLLCVRYRGCEATGERLVTVELVVDRWPARIPGEQEVHVRIGREEADLRARAKAAGANFDWERRLWRMPARVARRLSLARRIVREGWDSVDGSGKEKPDLETRGQKSIRRVLSI